MCWFWLSSIVRELGFVELCCFVRMDHMEEEWGEERIQLGLVGCSIQSEMEDDIKEHQEEE
jgi:hypothetical protein